MDSPDSPAEKTEKPLYLRLIEAGWIQDGNTISHPEDPELHVKRNPVTGVLLLSPKMIAMVRQSKADR